MRALSFSQPWLWSITDLPEPEAKRIENRSWAPPMDLIGERFALHAAKSWDADAISFFIRLGIDHPGRRELYPSGALVATAVLDRVVTSNKTLPELQKRWFFGEFGWVLTDVVNIQPVLCKGALGLWTIPDDLFAKMNVGEGHGRS